MFFVEKTILLIKKSQHFLNDAFQTYCDLFQVNALTANYEYSRSNTDNLPLPLQMQLSEKLKTFSRLFIAFFESALNFEHFEKKK